MVTSLLGRRKGSDVLSTSHRGLTFLQRGRRLLRDAAGLLLWDSGADTNSIRRNDKTWQDDGSSSSSTGGVRQAPPSSLLGSVFGASRPSRLKRHAGAAGARQAQPATAAAIAPLVSSDAQQARILHDALVHPLRGPALNPAAGGANIVQQKEAAAAMHYGLWLQRTSRGIRRLDQYVATYFNTAAPRRDPPHVANESSFDAPARAGLWKARRSRKRRGAAGVAGRRSASNEISARSAVDGSAGSSSSEPNTSNHQQRHRRRRMLMHQWDQALQSALYATALGAQYVRNVLLRGCLNVDGLAKRSARGILNDVQRGRYDALSLAHDVSTKLAQQSTFGATLFFRRHMYNATRNGRGGRHPTSWMWTLHRHRMQQRMSQRISAINASIDTYADAVTATGHTSGGDDGGAQHPQTPSSASAAVCGTTQNVAPTNRLLCYGAPSTTTHVDDSRLEQREQREKDGKQRLWYAASGRQRTPPSVSGAAATAAPVDSYAALWAEWWVRSGGGAAVTPVDVRVTTTDDTLATRTQQQQQMSAFDGDAKKLHQQSADGDALATAPTAVAPRRTLWNMPILHRTRCHALDPLMFADEDALVMAAIIGPHHNNSSSSTATTSKDCRSRGGGGAEGNGAVVVGRASSYLRRLSAQYHDLFELHQRVAQPLTAAVAGTFGGCGGSASSAANTLGPEHFDYSAHERIIMAHYNAAAAVAAASAGGGAGASRDRFTNKNTTATTTATDGDNDDALPSLDTSDGAYALLLAKLRHRHPHPYRDPFVLRETVSELECSPHAQFIKERFGERYEQGSGCASSLSQAGPIAGNRRQQPQPPPPNASDIIGLIARNLSESYQQQMRDPRDFLGSLKAHTELIRGARDDARERIESFESAFIEFRAEQQQRHQRQHVVMRSTTETGQQH